MQPRRAIWEFGALPVSVMPSLDSASLLLMHSKLLMRSSIADGGESEFSRSEPSIKECP